jgi:two-component system, cell cycle sensor histidine kinase and response regulator CckA
MVSLTTKKPPSKLSPRVKFAIAAFISYFVFGLAWIFLTDKFLLLFTDISVLVKLSMAKGVFFVLLSALFFLLALLHSRGESDAFDRDRNYSVKAATLTDHFPRWLVYLFAVLITVATLYLRMQLAVNIGDRPLLILFMLPVIVSSALGGLGPGLVATCISSFGIKYYGIPSIHSLSFQYNHDLFQWFILVANGVMASVLSEFLLRARLQAEERRMKQEIVQKELIKSEEKFRTVADHIHDWEYWRSPDGSLVYVSPSCMRITGYSAEEFYQEPKLLISIIHPDDRLNFRQHIDDIAKSAAKGDFHTVEFRILTRNGEERLIEHICREVFSREGSVLGRRVSNRDVTERKRAEMELIDSERLYRSLFENMMNGFAYCRMLFENGKPTDFIYLAVNGAFDKQTGLKDVVGRKVTEVIPGIRDSDPELFEIYGRVAMTHEPTRLEVFVEALQLWFSISVYSPSHEHFVAVFDVITERKKAEEALRESETRLKLVLDGSQLGFWDWNIETGEVVRNARWAEMLGYTLEEVEISVKQWTDLHHPDDRDLAWKSINDHLEGRTSVHRIEYRMLAKDGHYKWILDQAKIVRWDSQGKPMRMCGTHTDITERKVAELDREKLQIQLNQAQKMESVGRLAGGVAHDFNNMLGVILGYTELALEQAEKNQPLHSALKEIQMAAQRSAELTRQLLAFARKQTVVPKVLDLNATVESMLSMLRRLIGENIDLVWLPMKKPALIKMDPSQIDQILANLCVNARDAITDNGKITVETDNIDVGETFQVQHVDFQPGKYVLLAVSDNGCGMSMETQRKLFEPFFTTKELGKGTGLGLASIYGIVKQNNGYITVYSELGLGSTFKIYLPQHETDAEQGDNRDLVVPAMRGNETILLVEDEPAILRMTTRMLEQLGYRVLSTNIPAEAVDLARTHEGEIHLLMTDVVMPGTNGRDLAKSILPLRPGLKCLFMSGYTSNVIAHHGVLDEGVFFIQKPFSKKDVADKIRQALCQDPD